MRACRTAMEDVTRRWVFWERSGATTCASALLIRLPGWWGSAKASKRGQGRCRRRRSKAGSFRTQTYRPASRQYRFPCWADQTRRGYERGLLPTPAHATRSLRYPRLPPGIHCYVEHIECGKCSFRRRSCTNECGACSGIFNLPASACKSPIAPSNWTTWTVIDYGGCGGHAAEWRFLASQSRGSSRRLQSKQLLIVG